MVPSTLSGGKGLTSLTDRVRAEETGPYLVSSLYGRLRSLRVTVLLCHPVGV